jgi:hypothetical protein
MRGRPRVLTPLPLLALSERGWQHRSFIFLAGQRRPRSQPSTVTDAAIASTAVAVEALPSRHVGHTPDGGGGSTSP